MNPIIFDLTSKLPGPLGTAQLIQYEMEVYKVENRKDFFKDSQIDSFKLWYDEINKDKVIISGDLPELISKYKPFLILASKAPKENQTFNTNWLIIKGNKKQTPLHDLRGFKILCV